MSKIALPIAELKPALMGLGKVIAKRCALPVLNHLKIERTKDGWIAITGTDLECFITVRLEQPSDGQPLSLLVPYDELLKLTKTCPKTDTLLIRSEEKASDPSAIIEYAVGGQVAETKVGSLPVEEFPEIPRIKGDAIPVNDALRHSIHEAFDCASTDETRQILNSAYIDVSKPDGHYVVGTDGRHLFSSNSFKLPMKECFILPAHKFLGYREFNNDGEWQLKIGTPQHKDDQAHFQLSSRRYRFISRQMEGAYPNWRQVMPSESQYVSSIQLDGEDLKALADTMERLPEHDTINHTIGIERKDQEVSLLWKPDKEQPWKRLAVTTEKLTGPDITIYLNRYILTKALRFGLHRLDFVDSMSPMRFSHEGRQMIVMPLRPEVATVQFTPASPPQEATPQPAAPKPAAQEERTTMPKAPPITTNGNGNQPAAETKPALELALEQIETIKGSYRDAIRGLNDLGDTLKQVQREHKTIQSFRTTLEKLQTVRI